MEVTPFAKGAAINGLTAISVAESFLRLSVNVAGSVQDREGVESPEFPYFCVA